ncbi:hypothetical protein MHU86_949 [Fragilaria crotonensis]|nr:hypothetical protein MHU86_949 [Fragilaria crotonensis]
MAPIKEEGVKDDRGIAFGKAIGYEDDDVQEYVSELPTVDEEETEADEGRISSHPSTMMATRSDRAEEHDPFKDHESGTGLVNTRIADRESEYQTRRHNRTLREDGISYKEAMLHANLDREKHELIQEARKDLLDDDGKLKENPNPISEKRRKRRWDDVSSSAGADTTEASKQEPSLVSDTESVAKNRWDEDEKAGATTRRRKRWDETPIASSSVTATPVAGAPDATPVVGRTTRKWDETPVSGALVAATPSAAGERKRNRWDQTPVTTSVVPIPSATPLAGATGTLAKALALEREMESRNRPWTEAALDAILPSEGYVIIRPPATYVPLRTPGRKLLATPTPFGMTPAGFQMEVPIEQRADATAQEIREAYGVPLAASSAETGDMGSLPYIKPEDMQYFAA